MLWQFVKRHRRKLFLLSVIGGGGYAAFRFLSGKISSMIAEQEKMVNDWKKQLYYEHNRDTSLKTSNEIFSQVLLNINRAFQCENILQTLSSVTDPTAKRQLWEELKIECFARLVTFTYSSAFVLSLTELVVSALSGRLYAQSQLQQSSPGEAISGVSTTSKSSHAESTQEKFSLLSRDVQLACLDVIRYATEIGLNQLIDDVRQASRSIFSRISLQQNLDIHDLIWYCSEVRHQIEKKRYNAFGENSPLLKFVRSSTLTRRRSGPPPPPLPATTTTTMNYSFSNVVSSASAFFHNERAAPPTIFNLQQQFEIECVELIESERFQRVLTQILDQSFSNIYDEFAREMVKIPRTTENPSNDSTLISDQQVPLAKIIPMSNNIYSKYANHPQQLTIHFQSLACRPELHEFTRYAYDLFSNESAESPSRTAYSLLPVGSTASIQANLTSFLQSLMSP